MAIKYNWLIELEELLFELFKEHSSKIMKLDWFKIHIGFFIFFCATLIPKAKLVVALAIAIIMCLAYILVVDIEPPVELWMKYREFMKRLKHRFVDGNGHEANKVSLKELLSRVDLSRKRLDIIVEEKNRLEKLLKEEKKNVSLLQMERVRLFNLLKRDRIAYHELRHKVDVDKAMHQERLEQQVMRAEQLENDLKIQMGNGEYMQKEVEKYKLMVDEKHELIKILQQDMDRNLNLKKVQEDMWNVMKSEIEKNSRSNELAAQLNVLIEKTERTEEKCDTIKSLSKKMKCLVKLEKQRNKLWEQNRYLSDTAKKESEIMLLDKFEGMMELLKAYILVDGQESKKMLENQDTLLNLLNESKSQSEGEVSSDDGFEVVE